MLKALYAVFGLLVLAGYTSLLWRGYEINPPGQRQYTEWK